jgi:hypothetical protein
MAVTMKERQVRVLVVKPVSIPVMDFDNVFCQET